jgi:hypothetical protein
MGRLADYVVRETFANTNTVIRVTDHIRAGEQVLFLIYTLLSGRAILPPAWPT